MSERVTYQYEVIYLEYEQALELPYGLPIVPADQEQPEISPAEYS
jgi:hypothetical protein